MIENRLNSAFETLKQGEPEDRAEAVKYLGDESYAPAVPHLTQLVAEADPGTRFLAARALGQIGDEAESAIPTLLTALRDDDNETSSDDDDKRNEKVRAQHRRSWHRRR